MSSEAKLKPYHHGNLRAALIEAGIDLAREGGPDAVVVREALRRVGASHNAAYRHFPDRDALLKAVAERCMSQLAQLMERLIDEVGPGATGERARERLRATGTAYVRFAVGEPGLFRTAFRIPTQLPHLGPGEGVGTSGLTPFELLNAQLDALVEVGELDETLRPSADITAWSAVHGFSTLLLDGPLRGMEDVDREAALGRLLDSIERGLLRSR